jgi:hypothetical protein
MGSDHLIVSEYGESVSELLTLDVECSVYEANALLPGVLPEVTLAPTMEPTAPTAAPTHGPTDTQCVDGDHDCDSTSTYCAISTYASSGYFCLCLDGFENVVEENSVHTSATSCAPIRDSEKPAAAAAAASTAAAAAEPMDDDVAMMMVAAEQEAYYGGGALPSSTDAGIESLSYSGIDGSAGGSFADSTDYYGADSASTVLPTMPPTPLPCEGGDHDCDTMTTYCAASAYATDSYFCLCLEGFMRKIVDGMRSNNECVVDPTVPVPTPGPAPIAPSAPVPAPALDASAGSVNEDGSITLPTSTDGSTATVSADGMTTTAVDSSGDVTTTTINQDGSTATELTAVAVPNEHGGGTTAVSSDGSSVSIAGDGTVVDAVVENGEVVVSATTTPRGTIMTSPTTVNGDGSTTAATPDGGSVTVSSDGTTITTADPQGTVEGVTAINNDGTTITEEVGLVTKLDDGSTTAATANGGTVTVSDDGSTVTTTDAAGTIESVTMRNDDGTTTTDITAVDGSSLEYLTSESGRPVSVSEKVPPPMFSVTSDITLTGFTEDTFTMLHQQSFVRVLSHLLTIDADRIELVSIRKSTFAEPPPQSEGAAEKLYLHPSNVPLFKETHPQHETQAPSSAPMPEGNHEVQSFGADSRDGSSRELPPAELPSLYPGTGVGAGRHLMRSIIYMPGSKNEYSPNDGHVYAQKGIEIVYRISCPGEESSKAVSDDINEIAASPNLFSASLQAGFEEDRTTVPEGFSVTAWWQGTDSEGDAVGIVSSDGHPTHAPTQVICLDGNHDCDTTSTYCASTEMHEKGFFCLCLEGFVSLTVDGVHSHTQCVAGSNNAGADNLAEAIVASGELGVPSLSPTFAPTQTHCTDGDRDCDTDTTYCAASAYATAGYFCLCLEGYVRKVIDDVHDPTACILGVADAGTAVMGELKARAETVEEGNEESDTVAVAGMITGVVVVVALAVAVFVGTMRLKRTAALMKLEEEGEPRRATVGAAGDAAAALPSLPGASSEIL